jgi:hypothetical protein
MAEGLVPYIWREMHCAWSDRQTVARQEHPARVMRQLIKAAACIVVLAGIAAGIWWRYRARQETTGGSIPAAAAKNHSIAGAPPSGNASGSEPKKSTVAATQLAALAENLLQRLAGSLDARQPAKSRSELAGLRAQVKKLPRDEAVRQLLMFLNGGTDADTGLPFEVGRGGSLAKAPTLRVAALDLLGEFDPAAAADAARQILASSNSADEWAVALRNYYRQNQTADAYFVARVQEEFSRETWLQNPSAGLAESLDFPVAIGGTEGLGVLEGLLQRSPALRWAALAAMDAWVLEQRATAIPLLAGSNGGGLDEASRAALLSRADIRDDTQRQAIESYLASGTVPDSAKSEFLRQFPNQSMMVGNRLVTAIQPMTLQESAQLDAAALQFVDGLIKAGTHSDLNKELAASRERLAGFVASARRGGIL